jgi:hypothetical protein
MPNRKYFLLAAFQIVVFLGITPHGIAPKKKQTINQHHRQLKFIINLQL